MEQEDKQEEEEKSQSRNRMNSSTYPTSRQTCF